MDRREVLLGLAALTLRPQGALTAPRRPPEGPVRPKAPVPRPMLRVALWDAEGRLLARKTMPYARWLKVDWPLWLLPAARTFEIEDGAYRSRWQLEQLGWTEGLFTFRVRAGWMMWPREQLAEPWW